MKTFNWQTLIDGMLEAVWVVEPIGLHIIAANQGAAHLLGMTREELVDRPVIDLAATPEDLFFWEDVAAGRTDHILSDTLLRRADGSTLHVARRVSRVWLSKTETCYIVSVLDQSEQRRAEELLEQIIAELRATLESTADGILATDMDGAIRGYNHRFAEIWGIPDELQTQRDDAAIYAWMGQNVADVDQYATRLSLIARSPLLEASDVLVLRSGRIVERVTLPQYARSRPIGRVFSFRDITRQLQDQARLQLASTVFDASPEAIVVTDAQYRIVAANRSCERLTHYAQKEILGSHLREFLWDRSHDDASDDMHARLAQQGLWEGEIWHQRKEGTRYPCQSSIVRVQNDEGEPIHYIGFFKDLTEAQEAKRRIEELAYNDSLTGLPNRLLLNERIEFALGLAERDGSSFAVLFLDLDRFKHINDSLGHMFGDRVLVEVSRRIRACMRQADTAARLGGDEFVLLLHQADARGAEMAAQRLIDALTQPITLDELSFTVTGSIGIALYPDDGRSVDDLVKNADTAMYRVKEGGRSGFRFYQRQMNVGLLSRMKLDHAMRQALELGHFRLHYQPQVELASGRIFGAEALLRWRDPELGDISPGQFIPIAEESGAIVALGHWVLNDATRQAALWHRRGLDLVVAINVSALQFQQADFVASVAAALALHELPPDRLELELTESILLQDANEALQRLQALAALGLRLSIDDFGTGYSSLSYLKRFPIHKLKIDRSFVRGLPEDDSDTAIVQAVINLTQALRLRVIAEGVETERQRLSLLTAGCNEFQGFLCSPALEPLAFEELLRDWTLTRACEPAPSD